METHKEELLKFLKDFYDAVQIRVSIFDIYCNVICEYPLDLPTFCKEIRKTDSGKTGCLNCDFSACIRAKENKTPEVYKCHAGLTEAIIPIHFKNDIIGFGILAHMIPMEKYDEEINEAIRRATNYGVDHKTAKIALSEISPRREEEIESSVRLLKAVTSYLYWNNMLASDNNLPLQIENFIKEHISEKIDSEVICNKFFLSRTSLYRLSLKYFKMPITNLITSIRINQAKSLLELGKSSQEVAYYCGFNDISYFIRVFKRETGISPSMYRKK